MAIAPKQWEEAKFLFEIGKSLNYISEQTNISKGAISKKSNKEKWKKETEETSIKALVDDFDKKMETLETQKETIINHLATLDDFKLKILDKVVFEENNQKSLIFSNMNLALIRSNQQLQNNTKKVPFKLKDTYGGGAGNERVEIFDVELDSTDLKNHIDLNYKVGQAVKVIDDKANVQIANQNNQNLEVVYK